VVSAITHTPASGPFAPLTNAADVGGADADSGRLLRHHWRRRDAEREAMATPPRLDIDFCLVFISSPPLSVSEITSAMAGPHRRGTTAGTSNYLQHNAHISEPFAKTTDAVERILFSRTVPSVATALGNYSHIAAAASAESLTVAFSFRITDSCVRARRWGTLGQIADRIGRGRRDARGRSVQNIRDKLPGTHSSAGEGPVKLAFRMRAGLVLALASALLANPAGAETLRVGKAVPEAFSFVPLDIGMRKGIFARYGIEIESSAFAGDARMQQAMASDSLDIALGSGPAMAFIVKGSPIRASRCWATRRCFSRWWCAPTTASKPSPTSRAAASASRPSARSPIGWSAKPRASRAGARTASPSRRWGRPSPGRGAQGRDTDGMVTDISTALTLEKNGEARILTRFGHLVKDFHIHVIFARDKLIAQKPDALRGFSKAGSRP